MFASIFVREWTEPLPGAWTAFVHRSGCLDFNEFLSYTTCSINIHFCPIKGCILSCLFEWQNTLNWKIFTEITESNSWPCSGHPSESHHVPENNVQMLLELSQSGAVTASLGSSFQCAATLWVENIFLMSSLNLPDTTSCHSVRCYHSSLERRDRKSIGPYLAKKFIRENVKSMHTTSTAFLNLSLYFCRVARCSQGSRSTRLVPGHPWWF